MLWLCLHFPRLPLDIITRGSPEPETQALVVVQDHQVALCNDIAREHGISPGMSSATANALSASLQVLQRDSDRESTTLQQLAQWAYRYSPATSIVAPADILLEIGASLKLFHGLHTVLQQIDKDLQAQGFHYQLGLAHTPKAAWLVARGLPGSALQYFDSTNQRLLQPCLNQALAALPLALLDLSPATLKRLHKPGFSCLGDILALPRAALGKRFGRDFLLYLEQLQGTAPDPQSPIEPECRFQRQLDFIDPIHRGETLLFPMQRLLHELSVFLLSRQLDCPGFHWQLLQQDHPPIELAIQMAQPRHDKETMLALTRTRLESCKLVAPVAGLVLEGDNFSQRQQHSDSLFEEWRGQQQSVDDMLDKLLARLKPGQVYRLGCCNEHLPEAAWRSIAVTEQNTATTGHIATNRPSWLLPQPVRIGYRNNTLYWRGKLKPLLGPERIESRWWKHAVKRDYYIVRHDSGGCYWVYLDHLQQRWYLHGIFA